MMGTLLTQAGLIPALLVVLVGMLVLHTEPDHGAGRRFRRFLLITGALLTLAVVVATLLSGLFDIQPAYLVLRQLTPALTGVLALILLRFRWPARLRRGGKAAAVLLGLVLFLVFTWMGRYGVIIPDALLLAALWALADRCVASGVALGLVSLALLAFYGVLVSIGRASPPPNWLSIPLGTGVIVLPRLVVASAATLTSASLGLLPRQEGDGQSRAALACWRPIVWRLGLAVLLLGVLAYTILWASIWDQTIDLGILASVFLLAGTTAVAAGTLMGLTLTRWRRSAGLAFAVLVPLLMYGAVETGRDVSHHALTEARAVHIQHALERFHDRSEHYPEELRELVPRDLLWIPGPVIVRGYGWCYQGTEDGYRLGTFYREYWNLPFSLRIYASAGSAPTSEWACEKELAALKSRRDPSPMYERNAAPTN